VNIIIREANNHPLKYILVCMAVCSVLLNSEIVQSSDVSNVMTWEPTTPSPTNGHDWIQLTSKEWLKGTLEGLYGDKLEFDSDELGYREFKWKDVKQVLSSNIFNVRFEGQIITFGNLHITGDRVYITMGDERKEFDRDQLVKITPGYSKIKDLWKTRIGIGLNISKGNTDQIQYNMKANTKRRTVKTEFELDYLGNYVSTDNETTSESQRIFSYFDILKAREYFLRIIHAEYYRDPFQNIKYRVTAGSAVGYDLTDTYKTKWNVQAGPAYQITRFISVEEGKDQHESTPALTAGTSFNTELNNKLDFIANYNFSFANKKSGLYKHHGVVTLETELTDMLDFDITFIWDRTQEPAPRSDGTIPARDDFQLRFVVSIDF
jgi:hypothetical protein